LQKNSAAFQAVLKSGALLTIKKMPVSCDMGIVLNTAASAYQVFCFITRQRIPAVS
jgi:hypothetical protein